MVVSEIWCCRAVLDENLLAVVAFAVFYFDIFSRGNCPPQHSALGEGRGQHFEAIIDRGNSTFFENGIDRANLHFLA